MFKGVKKIMSFRPTVRRMEIHRSAIGHIIGRNGMTTKRIQQDFNVLIYNTKFSDEEAGYTTFYVKGHSENVGQAVTEINRLIAISNDWCRNNNHNYY